MTAGQWVVNTSLSPVDDSKVAVARVKAASPIKGWLNKVVDPTLVVRCKSDDIEVFVSTGMTAAGDSTAVTVRFDKEPAFTTEWGNSTSSDAVFYHASRDRGAAGLVTEFLRRKTMLFQLTPFNSTPTMTTFDLTGLPSVIQAIADACPNKIPARRILAAQGKALPPVPPLGISYTTITAELSKKHGTQSNAGGAIVTNVTADSLAAKAGIQVGDLILQLNDTQVRTAADFAQAWSEAQADGEAKLEVWRRMVQRDVHLSF